MPANVNAFKQKLLSGQQQFGCWVGMADSYAAEISATAGFDWLLIDGEHAPNDLRSILRQLQIISASNSHPIVRLPASETYMIKQVLDAGAQTLLIPMVESAEQATALVEATRYPPKGVRGVGAALARASSFNAITDYLTTADEQICLLVQIESKAGVDALDEILAVEGVDGAFIGPADLAADLGRLGEHDAEDMLENTNTILRKICASGKAAGILSMNENAIAQALEAGATYIGVGIDVMLFASAMRKLASSPTKPD